MKPRSTTSQPITQGWVLAALALVACTSAPAPTPTPASRSSARASSGAVTEALPAREPRVDRFAERHANLAGGDPQAVLDAMAADIHRQDGEKAALSTHYFRSGRLAFDEQRYGDAVRDLERAVAADPGNGSATDLLQRAHLLAGDRPAYAEVLEALAEEREASVEERRMRVARWFRQGEELMSQGRYVEAEQRFLRVLEALRWTEVPLEPGSLRERAQALLTHARVKAEDSQLDQRDRLGRAAQDAARRERDR